MTEATRSATAAGLAVLAVAFAAATLDSTLSSAGSGRSAPGGGGGGEGTGLVPVPRTAPTPGETLQIPFLTELFAILTVVATLAFVAYAIKHWRTTLSIVLAGLVLLGLTIVLFQFLSLPADPPRLPSMVAGNGSLFGGGIASGEEGGVSRGSSDTRRTAPTVVMLLVLGIALVGAVAALSRATTDEGDGSPAESDTRDMEVAAVGRAAGRAADRLEAQADVDNEVYRTWREMTELLDVDDPGTSTPGEFAAAAVEAGLGREDVGELTRLFEDVRYGDQPPSDEYERRAIAVFRRIEGRYAEDDP